MPQKRTMKDIRSLFVRSDMSKKQIDNIIEEKELEIRRKKPNAGKDIIMKHLYNACYTARKRYLTDVGGTELLLYPLYSTESFDWVASKVRVINKYRDVHGDVKAKEEGYIHCESFEPDDSKVGGKRAVDPVNLYFWEYKSDGITKNQNYGKKLPDVSYIRTVGGIASKKNEEEFKPFELTISNKFADPESDDYKIVRYRQMFSVIVSIDKKETTDSKFVLKSRSSTFFNKVDNRYEDFIIDEKDLLAIYDEFRVKLNEIEIAYGNQNKTKSWNGHSEYSNDLSVSKVMVIDIEPTSKGTIVHVDNPDERETHIIDDEDIIELDPYMAWFPETLKIDFGRSSELILFYTMRRVERKEGEDWTNEWLPISFSVKGYFVTFLVEKDTEIQENDKIETEKTYFPSIDKIEEETDSIEDIIDELDLDEEENPKKSNKKSKIKTKIETGDIQI